MNGAHLHLLLNHFPIIGVIFACGIGGFALMISNQAVLRVALWLIVLSGALALPTYLTGEPAEEIVEEFGANHDFLEAHEDMGKLAAIGTGMVGALALFGLIWFRKKEISRLFSVLVLAAAVFVGGLLVYTGNLGGKIMHPELSSGQPVGSVEQYDDDD
ncbi:MAG: hypothetical protein R3284_02875 [Rubricoccaceae bacterium]|nr:hypothetical protein [Rubricoccaceae bacterium]